MSDIRLGALSERENKVSISITLHFTYLALGPLLTENLRLEEEEEVMISFFLSLLFNFNIKYINNKNKLFLGERCRLFVGYFGDWGLFTP